MAQTDYFLKLEGIDGASKDELNTGEIEIDSWSFGVMNAINVASRDEGGGVGKASLNDITVSTSLTKAGPLVAKICAEGKAIGKATLTCRRASGNQDRYLTITLVKAFISSYHVSGHGGEQMPNEQFTLAYAEIDYMWSPGKSPVSFKYNVEKNKVG